MKMRNPSCTREDHEQRVTLHRSQLDALIVELGQFAALAHDDDERLRELLDRYVPTNIPRHYEATPFGLSFTKGV